MTCEEKIKVLMEAGDKMAALLVLQGGAGVDQWEAAKTKATEPPSTPSDPMEEWA